MNQMRSARSPFGSVGDELDRARADIIHRARRLHRRRAHRRPRLSIHAGGGRLFDHLLVAALERTVPLEQMDDVAVPVAEYLHLDMARAEDIFLDQHALVAERRGRLALARSQRVEEIGGRIHPPHPLPAATGHRFDEHRIADRVCLRVQMRRSLVSAQIAGRHRHAGRDHPLLGGVLLPHRADAGGVGADPDDPGIDHGLREIGILAEEAIARMDRLRARRQCRRDDAFAHQIAFARRRRPDRHRIVRHPHMHRLRIGVRIYRHGPYPHRPRGADDATGDLAAIGDQEGLDHAHIRNRPNDGRSAMGAFSVAAKARPSTSRVCAGSMIPSSHSRAVA